MRPPRPNRAIPPAQRGSLLLEALIGAVIFAVGVLALLGLQGKMQRASAEAKDRADAAYLAADLVARMRTDAGNLINYDKNCPIAYGPCKDWQNKAYALLPGLNALAVAVNSASGTTATSGNVTITLSWATTATGTTHTYTTYTSVDAPQ